MTLAFLSVAAILLLCVGGFVIWPFLEQSPSQEASHLQGFRRLLFLHHERQRLLENLKDLEQDRELGKLDPHDFEQLKSEILVFLGPCYEEIDLIEKTQEPYISIARDLQTQGEKKSA